jgi:hypothetical protein
MGSPSSLSRLLCALLTALTLAPAGRASAIPSALDLSPRSASSAVGLAPVCLRGGRTLSMPPLRPTEAPHLDTAYAKEALW